MTHTEPKADPQYLPYQAKFFESFVADVEPGSVHVLCGPVGSGKTFVAARSISELVRVGRMERVLLLAPAALAAHWAYILTDLGHEPIVIDGRSQRLIRERIGNSPGHLPNGVYVMSIDLIKRREVEALVSSLPWGIVVVDEAQSLTGRPLQFVENLAREERAPSFLFVTHAQKKVSDAFARRARVSDWGKAVEQFRSGRGGGIETLLTRTTRSYRSSDEEVTVGHRVVSCAKELGKSNGMVLLRRAASSISSLEISLVRLLESTDFVSGQRRTLEALLEQVEQLHIDSRLDCFIELIDELISSGIRHVAVFCEYRDTLEYLSASIDRRDFSHYQLHGGIFSKQRAEILRSFEADGGVLIATPVGSEGVSLNFVGAAIHYDLPITAARFAVREGRYDRYGRDLPCTVYLLKDERDAIPFEGLLHRMVEERDPRKIEADIDLDGLFRAAVNSAS